jgi:putative peptidoglycan lipid II flippase
MLLLSIGTSGGVAAQMAVLAVTSRRAGFRLRLHTDPRGIGVRAIAAMAGWTIASVAAAQAVFIVSTRLASQAGQGAVAVYSNAYTLFQLPYAVIAVTVITGVLPRMSRAAADRDLARITADLSRSLRLTSVAMAPVAAALIVLGPLLTGVLFNHGNAAPAAAHLTGSVLAAYGLALIPFAGYQIMLRVFYALGDTRTPALLSTAVSATTIAAGLTAAHLLHGPDLVIALAGCTALAYALGLAATAQLLRRRLGRVDGHRHLNTHTRTLAATAIAAAGATLITQTLSPALGTGTTGALTIISAAAATGAGLYALTAHLLRIGELKELASMIRPA